MRRCVELDGRGYGSKDLLFRTLTSVFALGASAGLLDAGFRDRLVRDIRAFDDASLVLTHLRERGIRIGVVTNGRGLGQRAKLDQAGLAMLLDVLVISEEFGAKKPAPSIHLHALRMLDCTPEEAVFVGESEPLDVVGPKRVSMRAILRRYPGEAFDSVADQEIFALTELLSFRPLERV